VQNLYGANTGVVPQAMLKTGNGPQLLSWLEVQSTVRFAKAIAALCAANSQTFDGLSTGLRDTVISPYLLFRALAPIGNVTPPLPAGTVIPGWIQTVVNLCVSNIQPALKTTLSLRATGGTVQLRRPPRLRRRW
jgi:hypothetical protein